MLKNSQNNKSRVEKLLKVENEENKHQVTVQIDLNTKPSEVIKKNYQVIRDGSAKRQR